MRSISPRTLSLLVALALILGSCSSADGDAAADGVATLEALETSSVGDAAEAATLDDGEELTSEEMALAFSACMRDEGLDFPDVGVDAEGRIELRDGFAEIDRSSEDFQTAMDICQPLIADAGFGGGGRAGVGDNVEIQDALVEFSDCIRDAGFEVGDITLGGPNAGGQNAGADGNAAAGGGGQRQEGFGDPAERLAEQLGLDLEDADVAAAIDTCSPILDAAFAEQGVGQP